MILDNTKQAIVEHIEALGNPSDIYGWGGCMYAMFEDDETLYRFRTEGDKYYVSHCGLGEGCFFCEEEEFTAVSHQKPPTNAKAYKNYYI